MPEPDIALLAFPKNGWILQNPVSCLIGLGTYQWMFYDPYDPSNPFIRKQCPKRILQKCLQLCLRHAANGPHLHRKKTAPCCCQKIWILQNKTNKDFIPRFPLHPLTQAQQGPSLIPDFVLVDSPQLLWIRSRYMWAWPTTIGSRCSPGTSKRSAPTLLQVPSGPGTSGCWCDDKW